jgi:hypothetical protein
MVPDAPHPRGYARAYFAAKMGGRGEPIQAEETFVGRKTTRAGEVRRRGKGTGADVSFRQASPFFSCSRSEFGDVRPILKAHIDAASWLMTDDATFYRSARISVATSPSTIQSANT